MDEKTKERNTHRCYGWGCCCGRGGGAGFGFLLLVIGGYFIAQDLNWISSEVSFWPVVLAAAGIYYIARSVGK